jgi:hypothetical protein
MGLGVTALRVNPVQGADGHHGIDRGAVRLPVLKRTGHHLGGGEPGQAAAGDGGQSGAQLDRGDGQPALGERTVAWPVPQPISVTRSPASSPAR